MSAKDQIKQIVDYFKREPQLKDKTDGMAEGLLLGAQLADDANELSKETDASFKALQREYTENGNGSQTAAEITVARDGELVLDDRLKRDFGNVNAQLAQTNYEKASTAYVNQLVASLSDNGPYDAVTTVSVLYSKYPNGAPGPILVFENNHSYIWSEGTWKDFGVYQGIEVKDRTVTQDKTTFAYKNVLSDNLINPAGISIGFTLNANDGTEIPNNLYNVTDHVLVEKDKTYHVPYTTNIYRFDSSKAYLGYVQAISYTPDEITSFIRLRISAESTEPFRLNEGQLKKWDMYEEATEIPDLNLDEERIKEITFVNGELKDGLKVTEKNFDFLYRDSPNLFNKDTVTTDKRLSIANEMVNDANNTVSDFIKVSPNKTYSVTEGSYTHFYDENKNFISAHGTGIKTFTTPENAAYIRITVRKAKINVFMLVEGSVIPADSDYIAFNIYSFSDSIQVERKEKPFEGQSLAFNGDSIVENGSYMLSQLKKELGFNSVTNYGVGGTAYAIRTAPWDTNAISVRYADMSNDHDVIAFLAGTNDFKSVEITLEIFKEALHTTFSGLVEKYPTKKLVVFTMPPRYDRETNGETVFQYADAIMEVAGYYSIPCCDLLRFSQLRPWNETNKAAYITDGLHPETPQGYDLMLPRMIDFMKTI